MARSKKKRDKPQLTPAIIEDLLRKGYTQSDIAREWGYTRQYVSWIKYYHGVRQTPRELALEHFPFHVPVKQQQGVSPYRRLREHGEYWATGGLGMDERKLSRLRGFYKRLRDQVVEYDPRIPPIPGVSVGGGWAYRPREPEDEDLLIRVNEYTDLTDRGRMIWRFPPIEP